MDFEDKGKELEGDLFNRLINRFGKNCVYRSPKVYPHGQEKEIADILVLALPYAIAFQLKWKKLSSEDLTGLRAETYKGRLVRTLQNAAGQYKELAASLNQKMSVRLPQIWLDDAGLFYDLPLEKIKKIVPIVVVDFDDADYCNPEIRYTDVSPVIVDVPSQIQNWGLVHCYLYKDLSRILDIMFTVGDLLMWSKERSRLFGKRLKSFWGYNELTLFSLYLTQYAKWEEFLEYDLIWLEDNDFYERLIENSEKEISMRRNLFERRDWISIIEDLMIETINAIPNGEEQQRSIVSYLEFLGRILCFPCSMRKNFSDKIRQNLLEVSQSHRPCALKTSSGLFDDKVPLGSTAICIGAANYTEQTAEAVVKYAYLRSLSCLKSQGCIDKVEELLVVLLRADKHSVSCLLSTNVRVDSQSCMNDDELVRTRISFSKQEFKESEWNVVKQELEKQERLPQK